MRTCDSCKLVMKPVTYSGIVNFVCLACGSEEKGTSADALILSATKSTNGGLFSDLVKRATQDRTAQQIMKDCPNCGLDYMTQVTIVTFEIIVTICRCGHQE